MFALLPSCVGFLGVYGCTFFCNFIPRLDYVSNFIFCLCLYLIRLSLIFLIGFCIISSSVLHTCIFILVSTYAGFYPSLLPCLSTIIVYSISLAASFRNRPHQYNLARCPKLTTSITVCFWIVMLYFTGPVLIERRPRKLVKIAKAPEYPSSESRTRKNGALQVRKLEACAAQIKRSHLQFKDANKTINPLIIEDTRIELKFQLVEVRKLPN